MKKVGHSIGVTIKCAYCGKEFKATHTQQRFCCKKCQVSWARKNSKYKCESNIDIEAWIKRHTDRLEYVSGFTNLENRVVVRCKTCGHEFSVSCGTIKNHRVPMRCPNCYKQELETKRHKKALAKIKLEHINEPCRHELHLHKCKECGKPFLTENTKQHPYCSAKCKRKYYNRARDRRIPKEQIIDKDITLEKLSNRDNGICHICGLPVDWGDKQIINGVIVCGNNYPSIDHIYPISKGGLHCWNNVALAHRHCNTIKSDKVVGA